MYSFLLINVERNGSNDAEIIFHINDIKVICSFEVPFSAPFRKASALHKAECFLKSIQFGLLEVCVFKRKKTGA